MIVKTEWNVIQRTKERKEWQIPGTKQKHTKLKSRTTIIAVSQTSLDPNILPSHKLYSKLNMILFSENL